MPLKGSIRVFARACLSSRVSSASDKTSIKTSSSHFGRIITSRNFSTTGSLEMRFVQFVNKNGGPQHLGIQLQAGGDITDVSAVDSRIPNNMKKFLEGGEDLLKKVKRYRKEQNEKMMKQLQTHLDDPAFEKSKIIEIKIDNFRLFRNERFDLKAAAERIVVEGRSIVQESDVNFLPPVTRMDKLACVGLNYTGHCKETGKEPPKSPVMFSKFPSNIIGPHDDIVLPSISDKVDWEVELAIVIGKKGKSLNNHEAEDYIFGYTIAQDISARDWQKGTRNGGQYLLGKAMDTFCPLGPAIITKEAICDINNLSVKTWVNGQLKQNGNTSELIFKPHDIVAYLSQFVTLLPGDVILTGTPGGVGFARNPPEYLKKGDVLETEIESLGRLRNNVV